MDELDLQSAATIWAEYVGEHPEHADEAMPPVDRFGDSADMADELLGLVLRGPKRATVAAVAEFRAEGQPLPRIGDHWIVADGAGRPRVILRSTELRIGPLSSVDDEFAWDEGEGDRTREWWVDAHLRYFKRSPALLGTTVDEQLELVFERFEVAWPPVQV
ncbi:ASCH domain-containing protein [Nocardioides panacihumi]|uniref:ASCH domain-containing protein n=1 Tax=Nocardioides panacihumi TaxID=400774 RepID=A0ABN2QF39_9ACTN